MALSCRLYKFIKHFVNKLNKNCGYAKNFCKTFIEIYVKYSQAECILWKNKGGNKVNLVFPDTSWCVRMF